MKDRIPDDARLRAWYARHPQEELTVKTLPLFERGVITAYFIDGVDTPFLMLTPAWQAKHTTTGG